MSKIVNVPGTASFIPLDDLINIKIHASLGVSNRLILPENPEDPFKLSVIPTVSFTIVTQYLDDGDSGDAVEDKEDDDDDDVPTPPKKKGAKAKTEAVEEPEAKVQSASIVVATHDLLTSMQEGEDITLSTFYTEGDEKFQEQTRIRLKKYAQNLEHQIQRDELIQELNNTSPVPEATTTTVTGTEEEIEAEEEDTSNSPLDNNRALLESFQSVSPSKAKLQELQEYLQADSEKQDKRIKWLIDSYESTEIKLSDTDAYRFCDKLEKMGIDESEITALRDRVRELINEVAEVTG